jgi:hypothetical protein
MAVPKFYKIDVEREVVLQGRSTFFVTISRNDIGFGAIPNSEKLFIIGFPQSYTFEHRADVEVTSSSFVGQTQSITFNNPPIVDPSPLNVNTPSFNRVSKGLAVRNWWELDPAITVADAPVFVTDYTLGNINVESSTGFSWTAAPPVGTILKLGEFAQADGANWMINAANGENLSFTVYDQANPNVNYGVETNPLYPNVFDGTSFNTYGDDTGFITRGSSFWTVIDPQTSLSTGNDETNAVTFRIDYDGKADSHLKLNFIIYRESAVPPSTFGPYPLVTATEVSAPFGLKSGDGGGNYSDVADYQELHFFGYPEDYVRPVRNVETVEYPIEKPLYDDRSSYGLLKTNPKLTGNVKLTVDSIGDIWLNSFNANQELSDASYKKFAVSASSSYQKDLYSFFKNGQTPADVVFDLYEYDDQYLNSKPSYDQQFDNFYNYGVEQLNSKFYDEDFTFLAPIWLRKTLPDYFIIMRVDHPINPDTYIDNITLEDTIKDYMSGARIIKTFDLRASSKAGSYIRNMVNDQRWKERPLEFSWEQNTPTYWSGAVYTDGTLSSKGELIYDYIKKDRPVKEFEDFITSGFQRNNIISSNLLNLEFLFNDEEAPMYSINRYIGFYVTENQLAEFEIEPSVLGKITDQTPQPKKDVDGEPYSTRSFIQSNPNGIQIPVHYYHDTPFSNNTSIVPTYQGLVIGKFPLPAMVDDPLRLFYVRDRDNIFKKVRKLSEKNYGSPSSPDFVRATQLELFDTQEDISKYGGVTDIVSQFPATLLDDGKSQLVLNLFDQFGTGCIADDEEFVFEVKRYNNPESSHTYYAQVTSVTPGFSVTLQYFIDQTVDQVSAWIYYPPPIPLPLPPVPNVQPPVGEYAVVTPNNINNFLEGSVHYVVKGGYYKVTFANPNPSIYPALLPGQMYIQNLGSPGNAVPAATMPNGLLIGEALSGIAEYIINPINTLLSIDNYLTLDMTDFTTPYVLYDAWQIDLTAPNIQKFILNGTRDIDAVYTPLYQQFRWRLLANGVGLQPGDAWDYPLLDPNGQDYVSTFSNEGKLYQVAAAINKCINSFEGLPVQSWVKDNNLYLKSTLNYEEGNSIQFTRKLQGTSYYANVGFYETGNVDRGNSFAPVVLQITPTQLTSTNDIDASIILQPDTTINTAYFLQVTRNDLTTNILIRLGVNSSTYALASTTGTPYIFNIPTKDEYFKDTIIPFTFNLAKIPTGTSNVWVFNHTSTDEVKQFFVGGQRKLRNRARVALLDGKNYYQDRNTTRVGSITSASNIVVIDTTDIYVGAPISGTGIPTNTRVIDVNNGSLVMSNTATITSSTIKISVGELSILNNNLITQQWYQSLKGVYSRMKGWEVQGKYIYSLPYLDQPTYDADNYVNGYTNLDNYAIIQLDKSNQEFYYSNDGRIVAYKVYRPTFGIFTVYPIKEFDFDFVFSEYSYTPTVEILKYFFQEEASDNEYIELELFENFRIQQLDSTDAPVSTAYALSVESYDVVNKTWTEISQLSIDGLSANADIVFNTWYPLYDYDMDTSTGLPDGYPYLAPAPSIASLETQVQSRGAGKRNFDRRYLVKGDSTTKEAIKEYPQKLRIRYIGNDKILVTNYNYEADKDIKLFNGFAGIQDITGIQDSQVIENLKQEGKFIEALTYQLLLSEYDRLRENFNKDWAVKSKTVPYINKWVQEGTDARDNYYRLDTSLAFGLSNLSPSNAVDFPEPTVFTQEFPYIDAIPQDYPIDSLETSRSYFFGRLGDIAWRGQSWYDLITNNVENDWFLKYFSLGYPTEEYYGGAKIPKSRDERYTFFLYNNGIGKSQTLFRGAKLQITQFESGPNVTTPLSIPIADSTAYNQYKFSAIARFLPYEPFTKEKPVDIEIIKNDKFKTIIMIITVKIKDYRTQSGHMDYALQYFANDILKNTNQQQLAQDLPVAYSTNSTLRNFLPYDATYNSYLNTYEPNAVMRPRQGFFGGGYLQLGDKKLGGVVDYIASTTPEWNAPVTPTQAQLFMQLSSVDPNTYSFSLLDELTTIFNGYRVSDTLYPFIYDITTNLAFAKEFGNDGYEFNIHTVLEQPSFTGKSYWIHNYFDNQKRNDILSLDSITIGSAQRYNRFRTISTLFGVTLQSALPSTTILIPGSTSNQIPQETYAVNGGTDGFQSLKNYITFGNIQSLINANSPLVEYYNVTDAGKVLATDYRINIINPDSLVKTNVLHAAVDEDKPEQYQSTEVIGYNIVDTNGQEFITRHRGFYEPKTRDIVTFWLREDDSFTRHFEKDFLLSNTHINAKSALSGLVRNYGINKVAPIGDVMTLTLSSSYKSLYPLVGEVSVANKDFNAFTSSWDDNFYRNYTSTTNYVDLYGIAEMKEAKSFLASKAMNVPKSIELHEYVDPEYSFELIQPAAAIGVDSLASGNSAVQQGTQYSNKPKLIININVKDRLTRDLLEGIADPNNVDEFTRLTTLGIPELTSLTTTEIENLKNQYLSKNIINIYQVSEITFYSLQQQGIPLVAADLSETEKFRAGYRIDKDCVVTQISDFEFQITKILDPAVPVGFTFAATVKRI